MEFKTDSSAEWFSGTPPLEALRFLCSDWASAEWDQAANKENDRCMIVVDVKKAHLKAPATREVYVELPKEDQQDDEKNLCGLLKYSMYGTRDAAKNWAMEVERTLTGLGFKVEYRARVCSITPPVRFRSFVMGTISWPRGKESI